MPLHRPPLPQLQRSDLVATHDSYILDLAYDFYGEQLATCSADKCVKIWEKDGTGQWHNTWQWRRHTGPVCRIAWSHPVYGNLLATCSNDRSARVYQKPAARPLENRPESREWVEITSMLDHRDRVTDVSFAPRHFGLRLATACMDGFVRIWECSDVMLMEHWEMLETFDTSQATSKGKSKEGNTKETPGVVSSTSNPKGATCLAWNTSPVQTVQMMCVGCEDGSARIWWCNTPLRKWDIMESLRSHQAGVTDVAWANSMGRSYHTLATADKTGSIYLHKVVLNEADNTAVVNVMKEFSNGNASKEVWRLEWNVTGTTLASSSDDGYVRLWKKNLNGKWQGVEIGPPEGANYSQPQWVNMA